MLHHLSEDELRRAFEKQKDILNPAGILFHSFWYGDKEEFFRDLRFRYFTEDMLLQMVEPHFEVMELKRYAEMEDDDSFYLVLKKE